MSCEMSGKREKRGLLPYATVPLVGTAGAVDDIFVPGQRIRVVDDCFPPVSLSRRHRAQVDAFFEDARRAIRGRGVPPE